MKPLKFPDEFKEFNTLAKRITEAESKLPIEEEHKDTPSEYIHKCAQLREARIKEYQEMGVPDYDVYHLCYLMSSDYEIGDKPYELQFTPEERYQREKKNWQAHETAWCNRNLPMSDENSCNYKRCVPQCKYFPETGRIEDDVIIKEFEEKWAERRRQGKEMLTQKVKEHQEWLALTDEERQQRIQQQIEERKINEAWRQQNQRGELGPINQLTPPAWWLERYRRQKQQEQQRVL
jgi:hypothetical protein